MSICVHEILLKILGNGEINTGIQLFLNKSRNASCRNDRPEVECPPQMARISYEATYIIGLILH